MSSMNDFEALRDALLGNDLNELKHIKAQFEDKALFSERVGEVLAQAVKTNHAEPAELSNALVLPFAKTLDLAVKFKPDEVTGSLAPVILPLVGKVVSSAFESLKENIDYLFSSLLTVQGLRWRLESSRTGTPYSELAFINKYGYVIESAYLNLNHDGSILSEVFKPNYLSSTDPDKHSLLIREIKSTVQHASVNSQLNQITTKRHANTILYTAKGSYSSLTSAVVGEADQGFLTWQVDLLRAIESDYKDYLIQTPVNLSALSGTKDSLKRLLAYKPSSKPSSTADTSARKVYWAKWLSVAMLLLFMTWIGFSMLNTYEKNKIQTALAQVNGVVPISLEGNAYHGWTLKSLHDPEVFKLSDLKISQKLAKKLSFNSIPFHSLDTVSLQARFVRKIKPPSTVIVGSEMNNPQRWFIKGTASAAWIEGLNDFLSAYKKTQDAVENIDTSQLTAVNSTKIDPTTSDAVKVLNATVLEFQDRRLTLVPDSAPVVSESARLMRLLIDTAKVSGQTVSFEVGTHLQGPFDRTSNLKLLSDRYNAIVSIFEAEGVPNTYFTYNQNPTTLFNKPAASFRVLNSNP
jgi:hypothetical protein